MRTLRDPDCLLADGLAALRTQFQVPSSFPAPVLVAAEAAARRSPSAHADWTARPFVTLDPTGATDLDQAFAIEAAGSDWLLHYAIADVAGSSAMAIRLMPKPGHAGSPLTCPMARPGSIRRSWQRARPACCRMARAPLWSSLYASGPMGKPRSMP